MTTIVATKEGMWADGRACADKLIVVNDAIKLWEDEEYIYGGAGGYMVLEAAKEATLGFARKNDEQDQQAEDEDDFDLIRLSKRTGKVSICNKEFVWIGTRCPYAIGTGSDYALGALAAGASPQQAIKIACRYDAGTGGRIRGIQR